MSEPATPGELNVLYLKAEDGIKEVVGDFTVRQHKHLFFFAQSMECQRVSGMLMLLIWGSACHAPGNWADLLIASVHGLAEQVSAACLILIRQWLGAFIFVTSASSSLQSQ